MLKLKLEKESHFLNALEAMLHLVDVASVDCYSTGLKLRAVHAQQIAFVKLFFPANNFQEYSCQEVVSMGIPIDEMVKVIRSADKDDRITMKVGRENVDTITMSFESPSQENNTTTLELPVVDDNGHRFRILDWQQYKLKYQAFVQMPSAEFLRVCKCLSNIDGYGHILVTNEGLEFFASGKSGRVNIKYMQLENTASVVTYSMEAPVSLTLDMKYMYSIAKASTLFDQVEISLSPTQLMMAECKIRQMSYIRFFLAPQAIIRETEEAENKRDDKDERRAEEDKGSAEINGSGEEDKGSAEINGSAEENKGNGEGSAATLLELKLEKESLFLNALEAMLHLVDVASVDCSSMGLKLCAGDSKDIVVALFFPAAKDFQHYCCNKVFSMGVPINDMVKAIDCAHKDDTITIKVVGENFHTITISFESPQGNNTVAYDLRVVDASSHRFYIPDWQDLKRKYQAFVQMPSVEFMRVWKCLSNMDSDGRISVTQKGLNFSAFGKSGCMNINYMQPEKAATAPVVTYSMTAPVSLTLDMKYMYSIAKASTQFDQVEVSLSPTQYLMVECKIRQMGYIRFFLAPNVRIRETEEAEVSKRKRFRGTTKAKGEDRKKKGAEGIIKNKEKIELDEKETED